MNERIKELTKQCYETGPIGKDGWPEYSKFNEEKFAELIVRKCADVLITEMNRLDSLDRVVAAQTMDTAQVLIRQHFGVEQ